VSFGVSRKHFDQNTTLGADTLQSPVTYLPFSLTYNGQHVTDKTTMGFSVAGNFGARGVGSSRGEFDNQRFKSHSDFAYLRASFNYTHQFAGDYSIAFRADAQGSDSPLVSSEQFAAGGAGSVRGYLSAENTADNGAIGSVELRSPSVASWLGKPIDEWRFHVFLDGSRLLLISPLPEQKSRFTLLSTGIGTRFALFGSVKGEVEYAFPLKDGVRTKAHDGQWLFNVKAGL